MSAYFIALPAPSQIRTVSYCVHVAFATSAFAFVSLLISGLFG